MTKRILIDARQTEETRVVLLNGTRIDDFDYEAETRKQLKGNVYLARVTRVEPSLQAAFVEYGGNRQGFLAFSEIHPDYYRIPIEDREALLEAENVANNNDEESDGKTQSDIPETVGGESAEDEEVIPKRNVKKYKIQEVVSRKQIMLIQVVKEERGNKGAALTTYLSLAGRYCVLMPNNSRGGGVSRKITNLADRKRLKTVVGGLDIAKGMAVIVRTAGSKRTKTEIARDYAYLSKLWDDIRNRTLESKAPSLIHEEGDLIKRSIRDMYTNEVDEVLVEGEEAYKIARTQMKMLIPSHLKNVKKFEGTQPIFQHFNVESQMSSIQSPQVTLKSGGYLVINQTEALVAVDVNSGKSTRERNIEETALKTNIEAAEELARQLRLRDMSGLIVVDFIDMEDTRNQHAVERRMKDAMRNDRARIQVGSISHFGLLEMSRQRLRLSINESISNLCPHCEGTGRIRSIDTAAMQILRSIEDEAQKGKMDVLNITVHREIALFILNHKRSTLAEIESRFDLSIILHSDDDLIAPEYHVEREGFQNKTQQNPTNKQDQRQKQKVYVSKETGDEIKEDDDTASSEKSVETLEDSASDDDQPKRRRRGRRGGRRRRSKRNDDDNQQLEATVVTKDIPDTDTKSNSVANIEASPDNGTDAKPKKAVRGRGHPQPIAKSDAKSPLDTKTDVEIKVTNVNVTNSSTSNRDTNAKLPKTVRKKAARPTSKEVDKTSEVIGDGKIKTVVTGPGDGRKAKSSSSKSVAKTPITDSKSDVNGKVKNKEMATKARQKKVSKKTAKSAAIDTASAKSLVIDEPSTARAPMSSAPQNVIEVGNKNPEARKRGWWSRS